MGAEKQKIKERRLMTRTKYSILKEEINDDECGWSYNGKQTKSTKMVNNHTLVFYGKFLITPFYIFILFPSTVIKVLHMYCI
jgi:hypothetical protein